MNELPIKMKQNLKAYTLQGDFLLIKIIIKAYVWFVTFKTHITGRNDIEY